MIEITEKLLIGQQKRRTRVLDFESAALTFAYPFCPEVIKNVLKPGLGREAGVRFWESFPPNFFKYLPISCLMSIHFKNPAVCLRTPLASLAPTNPPTDATVGFHGPTEEQHSIDRCAIRAERFSSAQAFTEQIRQGSSVQLLRVAKNSLEVITYEEYVDWFPWARQVCDDYATYLGIVDDPLTLLDGRRVVERVPQSPDGTRHFEESLILEEVGDEYVEVSNPGLILKKGKPYRFYIQRAPYEHVVDSDETWSLWKRIRADRVVDVSPHYIVLETKGHTASPLDHDVAIFELDGSPVAYHHGIFYRPRGLAYREVQLWERDANSQHAALPKFIATKGRTLIDPDIDLSGHIVQNGNTSEPKSILYCNQLLPLIDPTPYRDGWYYMRRGDMVIRFRETAEGAMLFEEMPPRAIRYPENSPVFVRYAGELLMVRRITDHGHLIHAGGEILISESQGDLRRIDYKLYTFKRDEYVRYDDFAWRNLPRNRDAAFPEGYERIDIYLTDQYFGEDNAKIVKYRQYRIQYGDHEVLLQLPDESDSENIARQTHDILCNMPHDLLKGGRKITVLSRGREFGEKSTLGAYSLGHVMTLHPAHHRISDEGATFEELLYHEFGHSFAQDIPALFECALRDGARNAFMRDGQWGYTSYASENWREAISVGFQRIDKACYAMKQLILNLLLNPLFNREHPRFSI